MELGETLVITAVITSNTYLATRSRDNSELTIRVAPAGGSPRPILKRTIPRSPPATLSTKPSILNTLELDLQATIPQDKTMMQGWAMVSTQQPQSAWDIAWVCTATLPVPKISIMLESELNIKPCIPSKFEEIESIKEIEASPMMNGADRTEPLQFEIKTKDAHTFKIITNNSMTNGMRRLQTILANSVSTGIHFSNDSPNPKTIIRVSTPKPPLSTSTEKPPSQLSLNDSGPGSKRLLPPQNQLVETARSMLQHRSASFDVIPPIPNFKPAPRPVSLNVNDLIKKNFDTPKRNDPRSFLKMHSTRSKLARKPIPHTVAIVPSALITNKMLELNKCNGESDFSDTDDNASNFSEDMESNSLRDSANLQRGYADDCYHEIRDLCERTKGLSPDINFILQCNTDYDSDASSSCFSEDMDDNSLQEDAPLPPPPQSAPAEEISDNFSESSGISSITNSGVFDGMAVGRSDPGIRVLSKSSMKRSGSEMLTRRKSVRLVKFKIIPHQEKLEKKKRDKEAREAARLSRKIEKLERKREERQKEHKDHKDHKDHKEHKIGQDHRMSINGRVKSWLVGKIWGP
eukprot:Phypoly_transcript_05182.p1 GENE.Phypoly_transcript_05182~~Phypoly_transcript_05182.p1  ORF type:complete len:576 (+),score=75.91 Phypoly_transcript_05182:73-1800(+)